MSANQYPQPAKEWPSRTARRKTHWRYWFIAAAGVAVLESAFLGSRMTGEPVSVVAWILALSVALPWTGAVLWLLASPLPEDGRIAAAGIPFAYVLFLAVGVYVGLVTGVVPK